MSDYFPNTHVSEGIRYSFTLLFILPLFLPLSLFCPRCCRYDCYLHQSKPSGPANVRRQPDDMPREKTPCGDFCWMLKYKSGLKDGFSAAAAAMNAAATAGVESGAGSSSSSVCGDGKDDDDDNAGSGGGSGGGSKRGKGDSEECLFCAY